MSEGRKTYIILLDNRRLEIFVQPHLFASDLLDIVALSCSLKYPDTNLFGLAFEDDRQQYHWLQNHEPILGHDCLNRDSDLILLHRVKFYVDSITELVCSSAVELMFLQGLHNLRKDFIQGDGNLKAQALAYALQICFGDFCTGSTAAQRLVDLGLGNIFSETEHIIKMYRSCSGQSRGTALVKFMLGMERMQMYGVHFYEIKDHYNEKLLLGIKRQGLLLCLHEPNSQLKLIKDFGWDQLENLFYHGRKFLLEVHKDGEPKENDFYEFWCETAQLCESVCLLAISLHQFYLDKKASTKQVSHSPLELAQKLDQNMPIIESFSKCYTCNKIGHKFNKIKGSNASANERKFQLIALKTRKRMLEAILKHKICQFKNICIREGELMEQLQLEIKPPTGQIRSKLHQSVMDFYSESSLPPTLARKGDSLPNLAIGDAHGEQFHTFPQACKLRNWNVVSKNGNSSKSVIQESSCKGKERREQRRCDSSKKFYRNGDGCSNCILLMDRSPTRYGRLH